jgi:hypothetical protein
MAWRRLPRPLSLVLVTTSVANTAAEEKRPLFLVRAENIPPTEAALSAPLNGAAAFA